MGNEFSRRYRECISKMPRCVRCGGETRAFKVRSPYGSKYDEWYCGVCYKEIERIGNIKFNKTNIRVGKIKFNKITDIQIEKKIKKMLKGGI